MATYVFNGGGSVILVGGLGVDPRDRNWLLSFSSDSVAADLSGSGSNLNPFLVSISGTPSIVTTQLGVIPGSAQFAIGTTAVTVVLSTQKAICFQNLGATDLYLGGSGVTTGNGVKFPAGDTTRFTPNQAMKSATMVGNIAGGTAAVLFY